MHTDVLKIDVDGAEWRAFRSVFNDFNTTHGLPVGQLQLEATGLDITPKNSSRIAALFAGLAERGFASFHLETNLGTCKGRSKEQAPSVEYALLSTRHFSVNPRRQQRGGGVG